MLHTYVSIVGTLRTQAQPYSLLLGPLFLTQHKVFCLSGLRACGLSNLVGGERGGRAKVPDAHSPIFICPHDQCGLWCVMWGYAPITSVVCGVPSTQPERNNSMQRGQSYRVHEGDGSHGDNGAEAARWPCQQPGSRAVNWSCLCCRGLS